MVNGNDFCLAHLRRAQQAVQRTSFTAPEVIAKEFILDLDVIFKIGTRESTDQDYG